MNGGDKLNDEQLERFYEVKGAFAREGLWVGWADCDPETADKLIVEHEEWGDEMWDDDDILEFVLYGEGDPDELATEYARWLSMV